MQTLMLRPPTLQAAPRAVLSAADGAPAQGVRDMLVTATELNQVPRLYTSKKTTGHIREEFGTRPKKTAERLQDNKNTERPWEGYTKDRRKITREDYSVRK